MPSKTETSPFMAAFQGGFSGILDWPSLDTLWSTLRQQTDHDYYLYTIGEPPPCHVASAAELAQFIEKTDAFLRQAHQEEYCGIVYADDRDTPTFIKIYHPHRLGVTCGPGRTTILPGWVISVDPPEELEANTPPRPWWNRLLRAG